MSVLWRASNSKNVNSRNNCMPFRRAADRLRAVFLATRNAILRALISMRTS